MKTFAEFISLIENLERQENENEIEFLTRILSQLDQENLVKFAYNAANSVSHLMSKSGRQALALIKQWLQDNESIGADQLMATSDNVYRSSNNRSFKMRTQAATASSSYATDTAYQIASQGFSRVTSAAYAIETSAAAFAHDKNDIFIEKIYEKKINEFAQLAISLVADKKHDPAPSNQWFDKSDKDYETIAVWLDSLEEDGHLEVLNQIKSLVQNTEGVQARANQDLAKLIVNSSHKDQYLHYIQNVFKGTK